MAAALAQAGFSVKAVCSYGTSAVDDRGGEGDISLQRDSAAVVFCRCHRAGES